MLDSLVSENEKNIGCIEVLDCEKVSLYLIKLIAFGQRFDNI